MIRVVICSAAAAFLLATPAAAQSFTRLDLEYRCSFQNNFQHPLVSQDCDNEFRELPAVSGEEDRGRPHKPPHKFKKKFTHFKWKHPDFWKKEHAWKKDEQTKFPFLQKDNPGISSASRSIGGGPVGGGANNNSGAGSDPVSRTVSSVSEAVGGLLD